MPPKYTPEQFFVSFWNSIAITADDNQCWLWLKGTSAGYGLKKWNRRDIRAHRIAWMYPNYVIPDGMEICHSCDNRLCCNPKHLFLGTRQDNIDDMWAKGRQASIEQTAHKGETNHTAKLTTSQVIDIRERHAKGGITFVELGKQYGVTTSNIEHIVKRMIWKHI